MKTVAVVGIGVVSTLVIWEALAYWKERNRAAAPGVITPAVLPQSGQKVLIENMAVSNKLGNKNTPVLIAAQEPKRETISKVQLVDQPVAPIVLPKPEIIIEQPKKVIVQPLPSVVLPTQEEQVVSVEPVIIKQKVLIYDAPATDSDLFSKKTFALAGTKRLLR